MEAGLELPGISCLGDCDQNVFISVSGLKAPVSQWVPLRREEGAYNLMPGAEKEAGCVDGISNLLVTKATVQDQNGKRFLSGSGLMTETGSWPLH